MRTQHVSVLAITAAAAFIAAMHGCATTSVVRDDKTENARPEPSPETPDRALARVLAAGSYEWASPEQLTLDRFPIDPARFTTEGLKVFQFDEPMYRAQVEARLREEGYEPASLEQFLAYSAEHVRERIDQPLFVFIVDREGRRYSPGLVENVDHRFIIMYEVGLGHLHGAHCRYLATPITSAAKPSMRPLADMLEAGHYDWTSENFTEAHFTATPDRFTTAGTKVYHFDAMMRSVEIEAAMRKEGYEPATLEHLLAYGAENPEEQRQYPIVALGSSTWYDGDPSVAPPGGDRYVPCLYADGGKRFATLFLNGPGVTWGAFNRFLAVPISR